MNFQPVSQNGIKPPTQYRTRDSDFALAVSTTLTNYGNVVILKTISNAQMYKTVPVTFYAINASTSSAITLGTSTFVDNIQATLVTTTIPTGTNNIYAVWPGEGVYAAKSLESTPISVTVSPPLDIGGTITLSASPASGTVVAGEGSVTLTSGLTTTTNITNNINFYADGVQIGTSMLINNSASITVSSIPAGAHTLTAGWPGITLNSINYSGKSANIPYTVLAGTTIPSAMTLTVVNSYGVVNEYGPQFNVHIASSYNLNQLGTVTFYNGTSVLGTGQFDSTNNCSFTSLPLGVGTYTFHASWDGNAGMIPAFIPKTSNTASWTTYSRSIIPSMTLSISPNPSTFELATNFTASLNTDRSVPGYISFFNGNNLLGVASIAYNQASTTSIFITSGTQIVTAVYAGSSTAPTFYSISTSTSLYVSQGLVLTGTSTLITFTDNYEGNNQNYVVNDPVTFRFDYKQTGFTLTGSTNYLINGSIVGNSTIANNSSTFINTFTNAGTYTIQAAFVGGYESAYNAYYQPKYSNTVTITVGAGYTLYAPISLTLVGSPVTGEFDLQVSVTTSTQLNNTVTFYANNINLGSVFFSNNTASLSSTSISNSGTYTFSAIWSGGSVYDGGSRFFLPAYSNTFTQFIDQAYNIPRPLIQTISVPQTTTSTYLYSTSTIFNITSMPTYITDSISTTTDISTQPVTISAISNAISGYPIYNILTASQGPNYFKPATCPTGSAYIFAWPNAWVSRLSLTTNSILEISTSSYPQISNSGNYKITGIQPAWQYNNATYTYSLYPGYSLISLSSVVSGNNTLSQVPTDGSNYIAYACLPGNTSTYQILSTNSFTGTYTTALLSAGSLTGGYYNVSSFWPGSSSIPKYYPKISNNTALVIANSNTGSDWTGMFSASISTSTYYVYNSDGSFNTNNITFTINVNIPNYYNTDNLINNNTDLTIWPIDIIDMAQGPTYSLLGSNSGVLSFVASNSYLFQLTTSTTYFYSPNASSNQPIQVSNGAIGQANGNIAWQGEWYNVSRGLLTAAQNYSGPRIIRITTNPGQTANQMNNSYGALAGGGGLPALDIYLYLNLINGRHP